MIIRKKIKSRKSLSTEERLNYIEKDIEKIKDFNKECSYRNILKKHQKLESGLVAMVGLVIAIVTVVVAIPSIVNYVSYENKIEELETMIYTQKYTTLANEAPSDEKRIEYYTSAIEYDKDNPDLYFRRAETHFLNNNFEEALEDCNKVLEIDANYEGILFLRGKIYYEIDEFTYAIEDFKNVFSLYDKDEINSYMACSYYYLEDYEKAIDYIEECSFNDIRAVAKDSHEDNIYVLKATCYLELAQIHSASETLLSYIRNKVNDFENLKLASRILIKIYDKMNDLKSSNEISELYKRVEEEQNQKQQEIENNPNVPLEAILTTDDTLFNELKSRTEILVNID